MNRQTNGKAVPNNKKSKRLRFKIEKLEERIAPAKGGIPGPGDGGH